MLKTFDGDAGERAGIGEDLLLGIGERVRRRGGAMSSQVEAVDLQPRLGRDELLDGRPSRIFSISGSMYDASAPNAAPSCTICCCMPWCVESRVSWSASRLAYT